ncbi:MAG: LLM class flavin-dependent oxidoreductase [Xenophilus sp.]
MTRRIRLNGFALHSPVHHAPGSWTHPRDQGLRVKRLDYWVELARLLEQGLFDSLFIADSLALHDVYQGSAAAALRTAAQVPKYDPVGLIGAMAYATRHLGFALTANVSYEPPFVLARRFSTLDHLTDGRIGWNVVTGYANSAARAVGRSAVDARDLRYDAADDFLEGAYKLWEGSWEDDAVLADKARRIFADPQKVHPVRHQGPYFSFEGIHLVDPSPQRTPLLFQAGASPRGRRFAGRHAEAVFLSSPSKEGIAQAIRGIRGEAVASGRAASDVIFYAKATVIVGETAAQAREKHEEYRAHADFEAALVMQSGWTGIDYARHALDAPFPGTTVDSGISTHVQAFSGEGGTGRPWILREVIDFNLIGSQGPVFVGSPAQVVDQMVDWTASTGLDGFNLVYTVTPESYADVVRLVVPELQARGLYPERYAEGTLREKLFGAGARLPASHPAARHRR